ncbi:malonate transporter subunit MadL [Vibrio owensii]|uniref:malonate transporter subunit MadL n=1 Tax=Vibrio owensii TaxID=696485 RepID=UPI003AAAC011
MIIYGVGLLAACTLAGITIGKLLGILVGIPTNVGGVGIAMIMLIAFGSYFKRTGKITVTTEQGVAFWSAMYIPIVVAMAAKQNVFGALSGGPMAITAGVVAVSIGFVLVPLIAKVGKKKHKHMTSTIQE